MKWNITKARTIADNLKMDIEITEENLEASAKKIRKKLRESGTSIQEIEKISKGWTDI